MLPSPSAAAAAVKLPIASAPLFYLPRRHLVPTRARFLPLSPPLRHRHHRRHPLEVSPLRSQVPLLTGSFHAAAAEAEAAMTKVTGGMTHRPSSPDTCSPRTSPHSLGTPQSGYVKHFNSSSSSNNHISNSISDNGNDDDARTP